VDLAVDLGAAVRSSDAAIEPPPTEESSVEYMFLLTVDESQAPRPGSPASQAMMPAWLAYNQQLIDGGHWISGGSLQQSDVTTVVRKNGEAAATITDGPFAETKEQVAGFYLVRADDLDTALALATAIPLPYCIVEVRPLAFRPDA
jgi:hypothetical protein